MVAALFPTADEMRRMHRLAYRMRQLQESHARFGFESRAVWQEDPIWQPLREVVERLLVTYDWAESLVALNLVLKPAFDELFMTHVGRLARRSGDDVLETSIDAFCRDYGASMGLAASSSASA